MTSAWPLQAARYRGVQPFSFSLLVPAASSILMTSAWSFWAARCSGISVGMQSQQKDSSLCSWMPQHIGRPTQKLLSKNFVLKSGYMLLSPSTWAPGVQGSRIFVLVSRILVGIWPRQQKVPRHAAGYLSTHDRSLAFSYSKDFMSFLVTASRSKCHRLRSPGTWAPGVQGRRQWHLVGNRIQS